MRASLQISGHAALMSLALGIMLSLALVNPVKAQGFSLQYSALDYSAAPGEIIAGSIQVVSDVNEELTLTVSGGDLLRTLDEGGRYVFSRGTEADARSLSPWLTFSPGQAVVPPRGTLNVSYQVNVPNDAGLNGTYWGLLYFARGQTQEAMAGTPDPKDIQIGLNIVFRYCIIITVTIKGSAPPVLAFTGIGIDSSSGVPQVVADLNNEAVTAARPQYWLRVLDLTGQVMLETEQAKSLVLPQSKRTLKVPLLSKDISAGEYMFMVLVDYGVPKLVAAQGRITLSEEEAAGIRAAYAADEAAKLAAEAETASAATETDTQGDSQ